MSRRPRATIPRSEFERAPGVAWNAFVELLVAADSGDLTTVQRTAWLAFWYDSEVQNGGHLRYTTLRGERYGEETLDALDRLEARAQREILAQALLASPDAGDDLEPLDARYHACSPTIPELLQDWLDAHLGEFVRLAD